VELGRLDEAVASYRRAIELDPKSVAPHYNLAIALGQQKKVDDSVASYRRAIELDPTDARYPMNLGNQLLKQPDPDAALASFRRAASLWSGKHDAYAVEWHANALRSIAKLEPVIERRNRQLATLRGERESKDAGELYQAANLGYERGDWQLAIRCYHLALELDPNVAVVHFELGCALDQLGRLDAAIASHERAIELDPKDARFHFNLAHCLLKHGELDDAIASFREFLELEPKAAAGWALLSNALSQSGETDEAIACARKAVELDPKNAMAHYFLGCDAQEKHRWDEAIAHYRATLETDPNHAEAHCNLAQCLQNTGHLAEALQYFRRGHELGSKRKDWSYPSAEWVRTAEMRAALEAKLPALLEDKVQPKDNAERLEYAIMCQMKKYHHAAARLFAEAFAADPKITEEAGFLYDAAFSPVLAAAGRGEDGSQLDERERARLRKQALEWLRADLGLYAKKMEAGKVEERAAVQTALRKWQEETNIGSIRDSAALALLSAEERDGFGRLWADVADLLRSR
jgi:superkiller protein 3